LILPSRFHLDHNMRDLSVKFPIAPVSNADGILYFLEDCAVRS
jgi:hypothetical protein